MRTRLWAGAVLLLLLAACATVPPHPAHGPAGGPGAAPGTVVPRNPPDVALIPDAVPRFEPRSALGNPPFYQVDGRRYVVLPSAAGYDERGIASWYGSKFHGLRTATGEPYDMFAMTAAHKTLPLPCYARVTNLSNGRSVVVRINDRGPFVANRIIDLSYTAAVKLGMIRTGTAFVEVQALTTPGVPPAQSVSLPVPVPPVASAGVTSSLPLGAGAAPQPQAPQQQPQMPPMQPQASQPAPVALAGRFYIQVGAFARAANAARAAQRLRAAGFTQVITLPPDLHQPLQRVRVGPIDSVQQFDVLIARLEALGFSGARLAQD